MEIVWSIVPTWKISGSAHNAVSDQWRCIVKPQEKQHSPGADIAVGMDVAVLSTSRPKQTSYNNVPAHLSAYRL